MSPSFSMNNVGNGCGTDIVFACQTYERFFMLGMNLANLNHIMFGQSGKSMSFACSGSDLKGLPSLPFSLIDNFAVSAKPFQRSNSIGFLVANLATTRLAIVSPNHIILDQLMSILAMCFKPTIARMFFAFSFVVASLVNHIYAVIRMCSEEEMRNAYTSWRVARVQHKQAIWDWPMLQLPCNAMSQKVTPFVPNVSVAIRERCPLPIPAFFTRRWRNVFAEFFFKCSAFVLMTFDESALAVAKWLTAPTFT